MLVRVAFNESYNTAVGDDDRRLDRQYGLVAYGRRTTGNPGKGPSYGYEAVTERI